MQRVGDSRLAATLVVGVSIALVAAAPAAGQLANDMGPLRSSLPDPSVTGSAGPSSNATARQTGFEVPTFGNPSGFGAGTTGFDSTGTARRKTRQKPKPGQLQPGTKPAITSARIAPATAPGTPGLRPTPQAERRGAPVIEAPPSLAPPPPIMVPQRRPVVDPTPFEPLGLRAGVFVIRPALELTAGYDSNPQRVTPPKGSSEFVAAPELIVRSDWERHALNADIHGNYLAYGETFPGSPGNLDRPTLDSRVSGRVDVSTHDRINLESRLLLSTDNPGSPNIQAYCLI